MRILSATILAVTVAACGDTGGTTPPADMAMPDLATGGDMTPPAQPDMTPATHVGYVITRDSTGMSGCLDSVTVDAMHTVTKNIDCTQDGDTATRFEDGVVYVLERTHGTLRAYDSTDFTKKPLEAPAGDAMHPAAMGLPEDIMPIPSQNGAFDVYVSFNGNDGAHAVGIIDFNSATAGVTQWVSVPVAGNDPDGKPEANPMYLCGTTLAVGLQDLDTKTTYAPVGPGRVALIDTTKGTLTSVIQLSVENPGDIEQAPGGDCTKALVTGARFDIAPDKNSGLEEIDLAAAKSLGVLADGAALGGAPTYVQSVSPNLVYVTVAFDLETSNGYTQLASYKVVGFDPSGKKVLGDLSDKAGFMTFLKASPGAQEIWFGVNVLPGSTNTKLPGGLYTAPADGKTKIANSVPLGQDAYAASFQ